MADRRPRIAPRPWMRAIAHTGHRLQINATSSMWPWACRIRGWPVSVLVTSCCVVIALGALSAAAEGRTTRGCGLTAVAGASVHVKVIRGGASCSAARGALRRYLRSTAPCAGSACVRHFGSWTCAAAATFAFPRLASCSRGTGTIVAAYARSE
jgi:hypothetical protein